MSFFDNLKTEAASALKNAVMKSVTVKVLGKGNAIAQTLLSNARTAVAKVNPDIKVEYVTDAAAISALGNPSLPALAIGDKVVFQGGSLPVDQIEALIKQFTNKN